MNTNNNTAIFNVDSIQKYNASALLWALIIELTIIFFFVPAGRFDFRPYGLGFSTGFNAYKLFPIIFLTWAIWRWKNKSKSWPAMPFLIPFASFVFFTFLSAIASPDTYQALAEFIELLLYLLFFAILLDIPWSKKSITIVAAGFIIGNLYMGGVAVREFMLALHTQDVPRIDATYDFPNALVVYCILGITLLMWAFFRTSSKTEKMIIALTTIVVLFCAVASISRGTYIAFIAFSVILLYLGDRKLKITGISIITIVLAFTLLYTPQITQRFMDILQETEQKNLASRFYIWPAILDLEVPEFTFFGIGMGPLIPDRMESKMATEPNPHVLSEAWHAHSLYLQLFLATGIMGLFTFIWLFWQALSALFKNLTKSNIVLISGLVAFLAHQTIEIHLLVGNIPIALFTIFAIASKEMVKQTEVSG